MEFPLRGLPVAGKLSRHARRRQAGSDTSSTLIDLVARVRVLASAMGPAERARMLGVADWIEERGVAPATYRPSSSGR